MRNREIEQGVSMKSRHPRYSIIMPVYNAERTVSRAVESVQAQTYADWELIAVDDGSTDSSYDVIQRYAMNDRRIKLLRQHNSGPGAARNLGIQHCVGDFVAFLDADDYWGADFIESVEATVAVEHSDVLFIEFLYEREDGSYDGRSNISSNAGISRNELIKRQMTGLIPWGLGKVFRRRLLSQMRAGFSRLDVGEEAVFCYEMLNASHSISFVEKPIYHHVNQPHGQHKKGGDDPWNLVVRSLETHLKKVGEFESYESAINSFALRALRISVYRNSCCGTSTRDAVRRIRKKYHQYAQQYDFANLDKCSIDYSSRIILALLNMGLYVVIIFLSRLREKKASA